MIETLTYAALGERIGCSPEAARALAKRKRPAVVPRASGGRPLVEELLAQIETLKDEIAKAERTAAGHRADFHRERDHCDRLAADLMKVTAEIMAQQRRPWWRRLAG
jgi:hypothetical protein